MYPLNSTSKDLGKGNFAGNVIPHSWFQHVLTDSGRPNPIAMMLLAEIVYWYRPFPMKQNNGKAVWYRHYKGDILQKSYEDLENCLGFTKNQIRDAFVCLEKHDIAYRELRTITVNGLKLSNVLFIRINVKNILQITHSDLKESICSSENSEEGVGSFRIGTEEFPKTNTEITPEITPENIVCSESPIGDREEKSSSENIIKKNAKGESLSISKSEIFRRALSQPNWKTNHIQQAIQTLESYDGIVNDLWAFIEGTVRNLTNKTISETIQCKKTQQKTCKSKITNSSVEESPTPKVAFSDLVSFGQLYPEFCSTSPILVK